MVKNIIIVVQGLVLLGAGQWFLSYKHAIEQTHLVGALGFMANETRFISHVERRLADDQCVAAEEILGRTAAANIEDMKSLVEQLDLDAPKQIGTALEYARILHDVGIHDVTDWIELRATREASAAAEGA